MKEKKQSIWRFVLLVVSALLVGFSIINFGGFPPAWEPQRTGIKGSTPFEKTSSMVRFLNEQRGNDFFKVFFENYNGKTGTWKFSIMVMDPAVFNGSAFTQEAQQQQQSKIEKLFEVMKTIFTNTANWDETAKGITVMIVFPTPLNSDRMIYGYFYFADEAGAVNIRKYPSNWSIYTASESLYIMPGSVFQELLSKKETAAGSNNSNGKRE